MLERVVVDFGNNEFLKLVCETFRRIPQNRPAPRPRRFLFEQMEKVQIPPLIDPEILFERLGEYLSSGGFLYHIFDKQTGTKTRKISVPCDPFKELSKSYIVPLLESMPSHKASHGGEKGWTVDRSLETHLPLGSVLSLDIKDAAPSVGVEKVVSVYEKILSGPEYELTKEQARLIAETLTLLSTVYYNEKGKRGLPIGSGISNYLFHRVCKPMDGEIQGRCDERGLRYTRWVDDLTVSSPNTLPVESFLGVLDVVERQGFVVSPKKTHYQVPSPVGIFLLGHVISQDGKLEHNSPQLREDNKTPALDPQFIESVRNSGNYYKWQ